LPNIIFTHTHFEVCTTNSHSSFDFNFLLLTLGNYTPKGKKIIIIIIITLGIFTLEGKKKKIIIIIRFVKCQNVKRLPWR